MSAIEKVLLRKDIASLIVAVVAGMATAGYLTAISLPLTYTLTGLEVGAVPEENSFLTSYIVPTVAFALQVAFLELLLRLVIIVRQKLYKRSTK